MISLSLLWNGSIVGEAANSRVFIEQYPSLNGHAKTPLNLYVGFGETLTYTLSFSGYTKPVAGSKMYFYYFSPLFHTLNNSNSADNFYTVWVDNWRMTIGGETYKASFLNDLNDMSSLSGSIPSVFSVPLSSNPSLNYTIECDVHIRLNNAALLPNQEVILNETHTGQSTSTSTTNSSTGKTTTNTDESGRGTIRGYVSEAISPVKICPIVEVELGHSNDIYFDYVESSSVSDSVQQQLTQQQTEQQHQDAQDQLSESQKQTAIQEEQKETTKGIFGKISDFFAGFFDGITKSLLGLFVPDDDYFSDFFARLNTFFEEKLGMLYTPIGLFVDLLSALGDASGEFAGIQFPGIKWEDTYLIEPQLVNFTVIPGLQEKIYFITDVIMVGGILWLLQIKMKEVLSG